MIIDLAALNSSLLARIQSEVFSLFHRVADVGMVWPGFRDIPAHLSLKPAILIAS